MKCKSQSKGADTMKHTATDPTPIRSEEPRGQTAKEAIATNIQSLIEQLEAGHSEALIAYLNAMSHFHNYSFGNILEIARQKPDATCVAGLYAWNQLGRKVKKGERGIRILAPIVGVRRKREEEAEKDITKQNRPVLVGFRNAYVFDVSQTEGAELSEMRQITGDVGENRDRLLAFIERQGIELYFTEKIAPALGLSYGGRIVILSGQSKAEEFSTIVHELAHEMLHKGRAAHRHYQGCMEPQATAAALHGHARSVPRSSRCDRATSAHAASGNGLGSRNVKTETSMRGKRASNIFDVEPERQTH
jgi:N-terminal domain of anti-restriction factor ArdC